MLFASYEFLGFLIAVIVLFYLLPKKCQWPFLLLAGFIFYYLANPWYLVFISITGITVFWLAKIIGGYSSGLKEYLEVNKDSLGRDAKKAARQRTKKKQWHVLLIGLFINIGILAVIKYTNFTISNINAIRHMCGISNDIAFVKIIMPMGISFYTFQAVGYLIDCYRGKIVPERNLFKFMLFVSFFPQLVQGPISRFSDMAESLYAQKSFDGRRVADGIARIMWGYFKKLVIADRIVIGVNEIIHNPGNYGGAYVFVGMIFYAIELYADFTGGIDITIGIAETLGVNVTENFRRPFFSKNIKEYWNRWHITMGTWFTDYIFYPVSVCKPMLRFAKFSRKHFGEVIGKRLPVYTASFLVWFATGIWHGASWNFIVWGLGNFVVIMISQELEPFYRFFHKHVNVESKWLWKLFRVGRTFLIMCMLRTFDCYRDVPLTFRMYKSMLVNWRFGIFTDGSLLKLGLGIYDYMVLAVGIVILITVSMLQRKKGVRARINSHSYVFRTAIYTALLLIIVVFGAYGAGYDSSQFIYNQF